MRAGAQSAEERLLQAQLLQALNICFDSAGLPEKSRRYLPYLLADTSSLSQLSLFEIAGRLSGQGAHDGGTLATIILDEIPLLDGEVLAAIIARNWHGGRVGFQFLPDPAEADEDAYWGAAEDLVNLLIGGGHVGPQRLLAADDMDFFASLPPRLTVYRGAAGISHDRAAAGVCWTTSRDVAEWFALRSASFSRAMAATRDPRCLDGVPVLVSARIDKSEIGLVKAVEFEVVVHPWHHRVLKCRAHPNGWRPTMDWVGAGAADTVGIAP